MKLSGYKPYMPNIVEVLPPNGPESARGPSLTIQLNAVKTYSSQL